MSTPDTAVPTPKLNSFLLWTPRILGIVFVLFISMFALDAFQQNETFWRSILAFMIHLVPSAILLLILIACWRWPIAGVLYLAFAAWYVVTAAGRFPLGTYFIIAGPPALCGMLFLTHFIVQRKLRR